MSFVQGVVITPITFRNDSSFFIKIITTPALPIFKVFFLIWRWIQSYFIVEALISDFLESKIPRFVAKNPEFSFQKSRDWIFFIFKNPVILKPNKIFFYRRAWLYLLPVFSRFQGINPNIDLNNLLFLWDAMFPSQIPGTEIFFFLFYFWKSRNVSTE